MGNKTTVAACWGICAALEGLVGFVKVMNFRLEKTGGRIMRQKASGPHKAPAADGSFQKTAPPSPCGLYSLTGAFAYKKNSSGSEPRAGPARHGVDLFQNPPLEQVAVIRLAKGA